MSTEPEQPPVVHSKARSREERLHSTAEALHSGILDGLSPTPASIRDAWDYIDGRRTLDELIEDVVRRHTRRPEEEP